MKTFLAAAFKRRALRLSALGLLLLAMPAAAGIPEPGLILYGTVRDDAGRLVTSGVLQWTFTPIDGGPAVTKTAAVREISSETGPFSYILNVPAERAAEGSPVNGNVLAITDNGIQYRQEVAYNGNKLSSDGPQTLMVSTTTRGNAVRVDIGGSAGNDDFFDVNGDEIMNAVDIQLVINGALGLDIGGFSLFADVNGDGVVDAVDVQLLINGVLGTSPSGSSRTMVLASRTSGSAAVDGPAAVDGTEDGETGNKPALATDKQTIPSVPVGAPVDGGIALGLLGTAMALAGRRTARRRK